MFTEEELVNFQKYFDMSLAADEDYPSLEKETIPVAFLEEKFSVKDDIIFPEVNGKFYYNESTGFQASVFLENVSPAAIDLTIAFAPAKPGDSGDGNNEINIFNRNIPSQFNDAFDFYKNVLSYYSQLYPSKEININFTGWSLGGALAQLIAICTDSKATTYSSPTLKNLIIKWKNLTIKEARF